MKIKNKKEMKIKEMKIKNKKEMKIRDLEIGIMMIITDIIIITMEEDDMITI